MSGTEMKRTDEIEIDVVRIAEAIFKKMWIVFAVSIVGALVAFLITFFLITPQYKASAMFYVNNNAFSVGDASLSISNGDLVTSRGLVESYIVILNTRETLNDVIEYAELDATYEDVKKMISASAVNETEIFEVTVENSDPQEAERIANAIAYILPKRIATIIDGTSAKVVDAAVAPAKPSSPSYTSNTIVGFVMMFILSAGAIAFQESFDITIRGEEDVTQVCKHPILTAVPDMGAPGKGGSYSHYAQNASGQKKGKKKNGYFHVAEKGIAKEPVFIGSSISFSASEAYKLLRTKLQFSFADDKNCRVIGLSSALSGEGKSLTSVNLAYSLAQLNKKVILIDCDMRRPTLAEKLNIQKAPGLSSYLSGQSNLADLVQSYQVVNGICFDVVAAGQNPPNPIELLSSARMEKGLDQLRENYEYIILDLPPVGEVSDAMAVANLVDGMLLVVRQNYCDRMALSDAASQFDFIQTRILGVVFNCASEHGGNYGKKYYRGRYKSYYKHCYRRYYNNYEYHNRVSSGMSGGEENAVSRDKVVKQ